MNAKILRALKRALEGRSLKGLRAPAPGSAQWRFYSSRNNPHFRVRDLTEKRAMFQSHKFKVLSPKGTKGTIVIDEQLNPRRTLYISSIAGERHPYGEMYGSLRKPLRLGFKAYRNLFRQLHSALGGGEARVQFNRIPNVHQPSRSKVRKLKWKRGEFRIQ